MVEYRSAQSRPAPPTLPRSAERGHLSRLATALTRYGVWARVIDDAAPYLRVSNPESDYAVEDVLCERRAHDHAFLASFGVYLGSSDSLDLTARKVAWLVGAIKE
ncbi:hypothetical protein ACFPZ0_18875 [Streptomonospora nanhaiensis]|uniref:Uncharacterized protein n=1 Tax=Streptomonospora nanhaiensis TaxID=1323731 RepID=A0A853BLD7_9ACTN|nr:hypothetical protein [Streptomonospora nanhaiensis]MBV2362127.1 hypothetical protein [Streptomonospora nanhaiensis]MBV2364801.1 hypothetical protein [Streptomonospora nanhaiensis]MBX9388580.1 hypothetical protein [Streptomonospora nanhaiensis]NYI96043.1 hypothetical protein [Streptomonospora nanhaiensis]